MLTLVHTQIHVVLPHDYICVALNKMTHLTLSNNLTVILVSECEIMFFRQLVHCQGSHSDWVKQCFPYESSLCTYYKYMISAEISVTAMSGGSN